MARQVSKRNMKKLKGRSVSESLLVSVVVKGHVGTFQGNVCSMFTGELRKNNHEKRESPPPPPPLLVKAVSRRDHRLIQRPET